LDKAGIRQREELIYAAAYFLDTGKEWNELGPVEQNITQNNTASPVSIDDLWIKIGPDQPTPATDQEVLVWTEMVW